jgi:hypothetical protein
MGCGSSTSLSSADEPVLGPVAIKSREQPHVQSREAAQQTTRVQPSAVPATRTHQHGSNTLRNHMPQRLKPLPPARADISGLHGDTAPPNDKVAKTFFDKNVAEASSRRFAQTYLMSLSAQKHTSRTRIFGQHCQSYCSGEGEQAPGFPKGGLKALTSSTRTKLQKHSSLTDRKAPVWWSAHNNSTEPQAKSWLKDSYSRHFGDTPPRLRPMLRVARKAKARLALAARQRTFAMRTVARNNEASTEILPDYDDYYYDMRPAVGA